MKIYWSIILSINLVLVIINVLALLNIIHTNGDAAFSLAISITMSLLAIGNIVLEK